MIPLSVFLAVGGLAHGVEPTWDADAVEVIARQAPGLRRCFPAGLGRGQWTITFAPGPTGARNVGVRVDFWRVLVVRDHAALASPAAPPRADDPLYLLVDDLGHAHGGARPGSSPVSQVFHDRFVPLGGGAGHPPEDAEAVAACIADDVRRWSTPSLDPRHAVTLHLVFAVSREIAPG